MELTLKDIKLPKDPLATDQDDSDYSSMKSGRERNQKWLQDQKPIKYEIPQNDAGILGIPMFKDQVIDYGFHHIEKKKGDDYSPTPNDWNQSDIDSEFHKFDPKRYPARKPKPEPEPSETVSYAPSGMTFSQTTNSIIGAVVGTAQKRSKNSSKGPTFGQLVDIRKRQQSKKKPSPDYSKQSNLTIMQDKPRKKSQHRPSTKSRNSNRSQSSKRSRNSQSRHKKARFPDGVGSEMTGVITQKELNQLNRQVKLAEDTKPQSSWRHGKLKERKMTLPDVVIQNVEMRRMLDTPERPNKSLFFQMDTLDNEMLNQVMDLQKQRTVDESINFRDQQSTPRLQSGETAVDRNHENQRRQRETSEPGTIKTSRSPTVSPWPHSTDSRNLKQWKSSTIQIQGQSKQLTSLRRNGPHQDSTFSFRGGSQQPLPKAKFVMPQQIQRKQQREETPEKILREFNEKARAYKLGLDFASLKESGAGASKPSPDPTPKKVVKTWRELMTEVKEEWDMSTADMYNPSPSVLYDAYLINLSHTVAARLSQIAGKNMRVNLRQGKPFKKIQINVTTVHQTKYRLTKYGNGFGYGTTEKLSPEDAFLKTVFDKVDPDLREKRRLVGQRETLAQLVPPIVKKAPKPITDSLKALHMACRRGVPIDQNGMPFLVEHGEQNRDKYLDYLQKNQKQGGQTSSIMFNDKSSNSIRSLSLHNKESSVTACFMPAGMNASMAELTEISEQSNLKSTFSRNNLQKQQARRFQSTSPSKRSMNKIDGGQAIAKNQRLIKKVDHLITKFDESFRQNEIQQKAIRDAQQELQAAKDQILERINQEEDENADENDEQGQQGVAARRKDRAGGAAAARENDYDESDASYKQDSCMELSDDEELNHAQSEAVGNAGIERAEKLSKIGKQGQVDNKKGGQSAAPAESTGELNRTFQTNEEREEYYKFMKTLQEKYSNLKAQADQARTKQWDTKKELRKVSQSKLVKVSSLAASKKSFKRNRNHDNLILNERSGDLMSNVSSKMLSPQEIFAHFEKQNIQKEAVRAKQPPSFRSTAERQIQKQMSTMQSPNRMSLMQLTMSKAQYATQKVSQAASPEKTSRSPSPQNPSQNDKNLKSAQIKYKPVPMQQITKKGPLQELSTERSNFRFDINEAANRDAQKALMNKSIMDQLSIQEGSTPKSRLPRKLQEKTRKQDSVNRDIEAFIASPKKQSPSKTIQATSNRHKSEVATMRVEVRRDEAYQTMIAFNKKDPDTLITQTNPKLPKVPGRKEPDSEKKTMHMTMTDMAKPFTPKGATSHSPYQQRDSGLSGTLTTNAGHGGANPMQTTLFGSEDFNLRERANQSGAAFEQKSQNNMQIVDEADETETINRPSFFDALQMRMTQVPSNRGFITDRNSPQVSDKMKMTQTFKQSSPQQVSKNSPSSTSQFDLKSLKKKQKDQVKLSPKRPIATSLNTKAHQLNQAGYNHDSTQARSTSKQPNPEKRQGSTTKMVDLKPISHTEHKKFIPHPNNFKRFRTNLPPHPKKEPQPVAKADPVSPYQMMLDEMMNNERPTIQNMDDSLDFHGGEMTIDDNTIKDGHAGNENKLRATYMAFENRLEKMMQQTGSTVFADQKAFMAQTLMSEFNPAEITTNKFIQGHQPAKQLAADKKQDSVYRRPYFKNEKPLDRSIARILERKFQETDQNFRKEAQRLLEDVRKLESLNDRIGQSRQPVNKLNHTMLSVSSMPSSTMYGDRSAFKTRHASLQAPLNQTKTSIKEKLQALKLTEANQIKGSQPGRNETLLREHRRRKSAFVTATDEEHQKSQYGGAEPRQVESRSLRSPFENQAASSNHSQTPMSRGMARQSMGMISGSMPGGLSSAIGDTFTPVHRRPLAFDQVTDRSQVSLTFKKFQQDSQKEHTREILPNVTPAIKR